MIVAPYLSKRSKTKTLKSRNIWAWHSHKKNCHTLPLLMSAVNTLPSLIINKRDKYVVPEPFHDEKESSDQGETH